MLGYVKKTALYNREPIAEPANVAMRPILCRAVQQVGYRYNDRCRTEWSMRIAVITCIIGCLLRAQVSPLTPIPIKVVVVTMFERGEDLGDTPGEFQLWVEREHLNQVLPFAAGYHHLRLNKDGVLGILTGVGTAKAAASVMALGMDPRFELSKAYWLVRGIGGGCPAGRTRGAATWE